MALAIANADLGKARKRTQAAQVWATFDNTELTQASHYHVEGEPPSRPWANADRTRILSQRWPT
jgi:hypothetical protein